MQTGEYEAAIEQTLKGEISFSDVGNPPAAQEKSKSATFAGAVNSYRHGGIRAYMERRLRPSTWMVQEPSAAYGIAWTCAFLGDKEKALDNLEKAVEARAFMMARVKADPVFDSLRAEPRYQAILRKMNLPPDSL